MQEFAITRAMIRASASAAARTVDVQKQMIAAMLPGDPCLPFACVLLCLLQQSAVIAEMNLVLCSSPQDVDIYIKIVDCLLFAVEVYLTVAG